MKKILGIAALLSILGSAIFVSVAFGQATSTLPELQSQLQSLSLQAFQLFLLQKSGGRCPPAPSDQAVAITKWFLPLLSKDLVIGSNDLTASCFVSLWQNFLVVQDKGSKARALKALFDAGVKKGHFGRLTGDATVEWQAAMGISSTFPGVGPKTRAAVANLGQSQEQLRVVTPNGGEILNIGQTYRIRWTGQTEALKNAPVFLYLAGPDSRKIYGLNFSPIITSTPSYDWLIQSGIVGERGVPIQPGSYKIRLEIFDKVDTCYPNPCPPGVQLPKLIAQDESDATFTIVAAGSVTTPIISDINPRTGLRNSPITITGSGFTATNNTVKFTSNYIKVITGIVSPNGTSLTFSVPATIDPPFELPLGVYAVSVTNANGTSNSVYFTVTGGTTATAPTITNISPTSGAVGAQVTITGTGFTGVPQTPLAYAGNNINFLYASGAASGNINAYSTDGTHISFAIPFSITLGQSGWPVAAGPYKMSVSNPNGTSNTVDFMVTSLGGAPTITNVSPAVVAKGSTVIITGSGFTPTGNIVYYDYTPTVHPALTGNLSSANGTTLSFVVPQYVGGGTLPVIYSVEGAHKIWVVNGNGVSNSVNFTVTAAPQPPPASPSY